ncbi:MAG: NAD(P)/FAD-dependent oxidoreductase, partial [Firmicutes bacterium]|nr:NAD(P)/FAD-dependent oxidoreductase [Bacillota bacterium]
LTIKNMQFSFSSMDTNNQVHNGGVPLDMLTDYLEYKSIPNLYFCGEVVDVDGICGGYNLQWAWTSGHIVGESL